MKLVKIAICFFICILLTIAVAFAKTEKINWIDQFVNTFELTNADFEFYNLKANVIIDTDVSIKQLEDICREIIEGLDGDETKLNISKDENRVDLKCDSDNIDISVIAVKKSEKESHIIVDILNNKVYKGIEVIYLNLESKLKQYSKYIEVNTCIAGEYTKRLQKFENDDILKKILYNMYAKEIDRIEDENFLCVNAYSKLLKEKSLRCLDREMNLNIGFRYSEGDNRTKIYIATPIIKIDY